MKLIKLIIIVTIIICGTGKAISQDNHSLGMFIGATSETFAKGESYFTLGLGYDYTIKTGGVSNFAVGFSPSFVFSENVQYIISFPMTIFPLQNLRLSAAPSGIFYKPNNIGEKLVPNSESKKIPNEIQYGPGNPLAKSSGNKFFMRFGVAYDITTNTNFVLTPQINTDIINSYLSLVYGINFKVQF
jgi:hypothetical protein